MVVRIVALFRIIAVPRAGSIPPCDRVRCAVKRSAGDRLGRDGNDWEIPTERRKQKAGVDRAGDRPDRAVEFRGGIERVYHRRVTIDVEVRIEGVVDHERDAVGNVAGDDVGRCHCDPLVAKRGGDGSTSSDSHFDGGIEFGESGDECGVNR